MKKALFFLLSLAFASSFAQGNIKGVVSDKELAGSPLPFADVYLKDTTKGTTTDFDGNYLIENIDPGTYTLVISFVGYEAQEFPNTVVTDGETLTVNATLSASAASLSNVIIQGTSAVKESEKALLVEQKKATVIKESIGAQEMKKLAIADAAGATAKISGVTKNESSGDVYVRGLGDRYLSTTLNGLPIPSDDIENKNIGLNLFPSNIIQNVGISKTYSVDKYADQASGNINIVPKEHSGSKPKFSISLTSGANTNAISGEFRRTQNANNTSFGNYSSDLTNRQALTQESWNFTTEDNPINIGVSATAGAKLFNVWSVFGSVSHAVSHSDQKGEFKIFEENFLNDFATDAENFNTKVVTSALLNNTFKVATGHKLKLTGLYINNLSDQVNEFGRNGEAVFFEETDTGVGNQFVRDQNTKQTELIVLQGSGKHKLSDNDKIDWGVGFNLVDAREPNRIRNEVNIFGDNDVRFGTQGATQQRKSAQIIQDDEFNAYLNYNRVLVDSEENNLKVNLGGNYRNKNRQFDSRIESYNLGDSPTTLVVSSIDNLDEGLNLDNIIRGFIEIPEDPQSDLYDGELEVRAGYLSTDFSFGKFSGNVGLRYEEDEVNLPQWDVTNQTPGEDRFLFSSYENFLPSFNFKYSLDEDDRMAVRLAASKTITLPEFKEIAPFEYTTPNGRQVQGNPNLIASTNYNVDVKYEFFPKSGQVLSGTLFYKQIQDPINKAQARGAANNLSFFNTSEKAEILGVELEGKYDFDLRENGSNLAVLANVTFMDHNQDLKGVNSEEGQNEEFRYGNTTETGLQGASDWIVNSSLTFSDKTEKEFAATLTGNYSSEKIFALGNSEDINAFDLRFNDEIIEEGFVTLDMVLSKVVAKGLKLTLVGRNLLNPKIKQTQLITDPINGGVTKETVLSYRKGNVFNVKLAYNF
ncbi:TonB-dependent receptor [Aquimarina agarilytica]|uniref:TonB-dependent receptor n=1 Tax=Aquimarina agarilytica TaxID=1087449 RepID=UPI000288AF95|nr:TonB-dependent receptor [Aquimarina agarilytica]